MSRAADRATSLATLSFSSCTANIPPSPRHDHGAARAHRRFADTVCTLATARSRSWSNAAAARSSGLNRTMLEYPEASTTMR